MPNWRKLPDFVSNGRRKLLGGLAAGGFAALAGVRAASADDKSSAGDDLHFPGDNPQHLIVYQLDKADEDYQQHVLGSVAAVLKKYGDDIKIVVTAFGPGIHVLLKKPLRPVPKSIRDQVLSLNDYGVEFHACGNTLGTLHLGAGDILSFAKYVDVGAADLMELQKRGYAYISW